MMHPHPSSGYSLLELLVVLGILSLILLVAAPVLSSTIDRFALASDARMAVSQLRALRERAMDLQKEISIRPSAGGGASITTSENQTFSYSRGIDVSVSNRVEPEVMRISWDGSIAGQLVFSNSMKKIRVFARDLNGPITLEPLP
jgi:prepilin-type N-terminal cleavage/methylation domain-containing protein